MALVAVALSAWMPESVTVTDSFYRVSGATRAEVVASVRRNGPMGGAAYGIGWIDFYPRYAVKSEAGACRISSATVGVSIRLRLPKWHGPENAPKQVARFADHFVRQIRAHEMAHVAIANRHGGMMARALVKMKPQDDCWALRREAEALILAHKRQHRASQAAYDRRTLKQIRRLL